MESPISFLLRQNKGRNLSAPFVFKLTYRRYGCSLSNLIILKLRHCADRLYLFLHLVRHLSIHPSIYLWLYSPFAGPWSFFQFLNPYIQSAVRLGRRISPSQGRYLSTEHKHRINTHRHRCLELDSKPRSQRSSEQRQFMP
jgi:hypothetical protein